MTRSHSARQRRIALFTALAGTALLLMPAGQAVADPASPSLDSVVSALGALPPVPDTAWGLDPAGDRVLVTVSDAAPAGRLGPLLAVLHRYPGLTRTVRTAGPLSEQILGGDKLSDGKIVCSAGFNVLRDGSPYLLTAGHCTAGLPRWLGVGPSVASAFPDTDFGLVRDEQDIGPGAVDLYNNTVQPITGVGTATVGEQVCASGQTTAVTCGAVTAVDQTVDYGNGDVVHGLIQTNVHTDHGDSGGALFAGPLGLGMVSGGDGTTDYFQPLAPALAAFNLRLADTPPSGTGLSGLSSPAVPGSG